MRQINNYGDERQRTTCVHCGSPKKGSRDHMPSRIFLDEPYPENLPVIDVCSICNQGFSLDEQYLSCFVECVVCGSVDLDKIDRVKIKRILRDNDELKSRLEASKREKDREDGEISVSWVPEESRARNVLLKLARGHALYELNEPMLDEPEHLRFGPLSGFSREVRDIFEGSPIAGAFAPWPEIGSRGM